MDIFKICGIIILTVCLTWVLKQRDGKLSALVSVFAAITVSVYLLSSLKPILDLSHDIGASLQYENNIIDTLMKVCGIEFLVQGITTLCSESGEKNLATLLEKSADIAILLLALPLIKDIFELITKMIIEI